MSTFIRRLCRELLTGMRAIPWLRRQVLTDRNSYTRNRISWGRYSYGSEGSPKLVIYGGGGNDTATVTIGQFSSIGMDVLVMEGGNHPTEWVSTFPLRYWLGLPGVYEDGHPYNNGNIVIGNDVWIGRSSRIRSGVTIGDGAVVAGDSVVVQDVEPYSIVGGNPAKPIRKRFTDEQIEALLEIRWWDWPIERIRDQVKLLNGSGVDAFIEKNRRG